MVGHSTGASIMRVALVLIAGMVLAGCSPYVNIPEQPGDLATTSANDPNVRAVAAVALRRVVREQPAPTPDYAIALPPGAKPDTYQWVMRHLPGRAAAHPDPGPAELPIYTVAAVYIRGGQAQVDVIFPTATGERRLMSVWQATRLADGWYATRHRVWEVPVDQALGRSRPAD
jgi:hypothetical protein